MADSVPGPDAQFDTWQVNFVTYANANLAALGLVAADMTPVTTEQTAWAGAPAAQGHAGTRISSRSDS